MDLSNAPAPGRHRHAWMTYSRAFRRFLMVFPKGQGVRRWCNAHTLQPLQVPFPIIKSSKIFMAALNRSLIRYPTQHTFHRFS